MSRSLEVKSKFSFKDDFSGGFSKMMKKAEGSLSSAETKFGRFANFMSASEKNFKNVAKTSGLIGLGIIAPLGLATKMAIDFESSMADVAKVANVKIGSEEFEKLADSAKKLSVNLATSPDDAAQLMANLAQGGVALADLDEVANIAGKVGVAFGVSADEAGDAFIKTKNAMGGTIDETARLMDAINHLGNTTAAASPQILKFMSSGGSGIAKATGASGEAVAAMGAQLISVGKSAEESATVMQKFTREALMNKKLRPIFDRAGGGAEGMMAIIEEGAKKSGKAQDEYFKQFGVYGLDIQLMAKNMGNLQSMVDDATDSQKTMGSVSDEFGNRTSTSAFKIQQNFAKLKVMAIELGNAVLPILNDFMNDMIPIVDKISTWVSENKDLVKSGVKVALVVAGIMFAVSAFSTVLLTISKILKIVQIAQIAWNIAMTANPIGLIIVAVAALVAGIVWAISNFKSFGASMLFLLGPVGMIVSAFVMLKDYWGSIVDSFKTGGILGGLKQIGVFLLDIVLYPLQQILNLISKIPGLSDLAGSGRDAINNLRESIGAIDVGGELSPSDVQNEAPAQQKNKSEVFLNVNNEGKNTRKDISGGVFNMEILPKVN